MLNKESSIAVILDDIRQTKNTTLVTEWQMDKNVNRGASLLKKRAKLIILRRRMEDFKDKGLWYLLLDTTCTRWCVTPECWGAATTCPTARRRRNSGSARMIQLARRWYTYLTLVFIFTLFFYHKIIFYISIFILVEHTSDSGFREQHW